MGEFVCDTDLYDDEGLRIATCLLAMSVHGDEHIAEATLYLTSGIGCGVEPVEVRIKWDREAG